MTHGHYDHILGVEQIRSKTGAKVVIGKKDAYCLVSESGSLAGMAGQESETGPADIEVDDGDVISVGNLKCEFINTPGHTCGSMCIIVDNVIFSGDTLFFEDCGRCDLPTGDYGQMLQSLRRLALLGGDYGVHPGHGESTLLSHERKANPYMIEGLKCK
ncbi:putative metallo-hydrolase [bioreactor metagenome]|uniref:Putative metallo-hydrolase n=1 Tax=bioreactor metagenome TaxID=1076179 RepID=A0A645IIE9_9ZZZZ